MKLKSETINTIKSGFKLFVIISIFLAATYAWFVNNGDVQTSDLNIRIASPNNVQVSLDDGATWEDSTGLNLPPDFAFGREISGNGVNFYVPSSKRDDGTPIVFTTALVNTDYLEFNILFRSEGNAGIFLQDTSYVRPSAGITASDLLGEFVTRPSSSGDFSRDLIASSVRIAFVENDYINETYVPKSTANLVWAPNKNYEILCTNICTANINSTNSQNYKYINASNAAEFYEARVNNIKDTLSADYSLLTGNGDPMIAYIDADADNGLKKVTVRIWIEGNDRDNVTALTGGVFIMNLNFMGITKQLNTNAPAVTTNGNTISGITTAMQYSTTYGLYWNDYDLENIPTFEVGDTVYVRYSETAGVFASNITTLNF